MPVASKILLPRFTEFFYHTTVKEFCNPIFHSLENTPENRTKPDSLESGPDAPSPTRTTRPEFTSFGPDSGDLPDNNSNHREMPYLVISRDMVRFAPNSMIHPGRPIAENCKCCRSAGRPTPPRRGIVSTGGVVIYGSHVTSADMRGVPRRSRAGWQSRIKHWNDIGTSLRIDSGHHIIRLHVRKRG